MSPDQRGCARAGDDERRRSRSRPNQRGLRRHVCSLSQRLIRQCAGCDNCLLWSLLLVSVIIVAELDTPAPPVSFLPVNARAAPPVMTRRLVSVAAGQTVTSTAGFGLHLGDGSSLVSRSVLAIRRGSPPPLEAQAAEAEEAQREHRPGRGFGDGRRTRRSGYGRATRHEEVQRRGVDDLLQTHASAAGPNVRAR